MRRRPGVLPAAILAPRHTRKQCQQIDSALRIRNLSPRRQRIDTGVDLDDDGTLTLAEASTTAYKQLAKAKILEGPDAWGPLALADGRLIVRDNYKMACVDVRGK